MKLFLAILTLASFSSSLIADSTSEIRYGKIGRTGYLVDTQTRTLEYPYKLKFKELINAASGPYHVSLGCRIYSTHYYLINEEKNYYISVKLKSVENRIKDDLIEGWYMIPPKGHLFLGSSEGIGDWEIVLETRVNHKNFEDLIINGHLPDGYAYAWEEN